MVSPTTVLGQQVRKKSAEFKVPFETSLTPGHLQDTSKQVSWHDEEELPFRIFVLFYFFALSILTPFLVHCLGTHK